MIDSSIKEGKPRKTISDIALAGVIFSITTRIETFPLLSYNYHHSDGKNHYDSVY